MDILRFEQACETVREGRRLKKGIGTLSETSVHAVLKNYYGCFQDQQEQKPRMSKENAEQLLNAAIQKEKQTQQRLQEQQQRMQNRRRLQKNW